MCDLNLPQPGPWRPVPLGVGRLGPEDLDKRWERGLTAAPGLCPDGSEWRHFSRGSAPQPDTAPLASGFSAEICVDWSACSCQLALCWREGPGRSPSLPGDFTREDTLDSRGPEEAQQRGHHCPGDGRGLSAPRQGGQEIGLLLGLPSAKWARIYTPADSISNCNSKLTSLEGAKVWVCVHRVLRVQPQAELRRLRGCGEASAPRMGAAQSPQWPLLTQAPPALGRVLGGRVRRPAHLAP